MNGNKILNVAPSENGEDVVIKKDLLAQFSHFELEFKPKIIEELKTIQIPELLSTMSKSITKVLLTVLLII